MAALNSIQKMALAVLLNSGANLIQIKPVRHQVMKRIENKMFLGLERSRTDPNCVPGIADDQTILGMAVLRAIERGISEKLISKSSIRALVNVLKEALIDEKGDQGGVTRFKNRFGTRAPSFLVLSPGKACNLRCTGCYADAGMTAEKLDWDIVDRIITEAKTLWGARLFVISGGEPFAYRSQGKGILELIGKHSNCVFILFTNGTLINEKVSRQLAQMTWLPAPTGIIMRICRGCSWSTNPTRRMQTPLQR